MSKRKLTVVIADDHPIFIEGLKLVLAGCADFLVEILAIAHTGKSTVEALKTCSPELLILDLNLPDLDGLDILPDVKILRPDARILVMTVYDDPKLVKAAFKAGIDGYALKSSPKDELHKAVTEVMSGDTYIGPRVSPTERRGAEGAQNAKDFGDRFAKKHALTKREVEVLRHISQALNNRDIGEKLYISDQTVSVHRKNIMRKLGVSTTASLVKMAYENHLI